MGLPGLPFVIAIILCSRQGSSCMLDYICCYL